MNDNFEEPKSYNIIDNIKNDIIQITTLYIILSVFLIIVIIIFIVLFVKYYNKKENNYKNINKNFISFSKNEQSDETYSNVEKNIENKNDNKKTKLLNNQNNENNKTNRNNIERNCFQINNTNYSNAEFYNRTVTSPLYYIIPYFNNSNVRYIYKPSNINNLNENTNNIYINMNTNDIRNNKIISIIPKSPKSINVIKPSAPSYSNIYNDRNNKNNLNAYNNNIKFEYYVPKSPDVTKMIANAPASNIINSYKKSTIDIKYSNTEPNTIINNSPVIVDIKPSAPNILVTLKTDEKGLRNKSI